MGDGTLPLAVEYVISRATIVAGAYELWARSQLMGELTKGCPDSTTVHVVFSVFRRDDKSASPSNPMYMDAEAALEAMEGHHPQQASELLQRVLARRPKSVLYRCLYAEVLTQRVRCEEYADQCGVLAQQGLSTRELTADCEAGYCYLWNHDCVRAAGIASGAARVASRRTDCLALMWQAAIQSADRCFQGTPEAEREFLDEQEALIARSNWKHQALTRALDWIRERRVQPSQN
jgi:hypothetical protein